MDRALEKWNVGVIWTKGYRASSIAIDMVDGSFIY